MSTSEEAVDFLTQALTNHSERVKLTPDGDRLLVSVDLDLLPKGKRPPR